MQQQGQFITLREGSEAKAVVAPELGGWLLRYGRHFPRRGYVDALYYSDAVVERYPSQMYAGNPLLFPQVSFNHTGGEEHTYEWQGIRYAMPQHGFARRSKWKIAGFSDSAVELELSDSADTLRVYPFRFHARIRYELQQGKLHFTQLVENRSDRVMPFSTGIHPYFNVPLAPGGARADCFVELPACCRIRPHGNWESWTAEPCPAHKLSVAEDASGTFFFTDLAIPELRLVDPRSRLSVRLDLARAPAHRFVALWAKSTNEPFYCIEPWTALPNSFARSQSELILLRPGEQFVAGLSIELEEAAV